MSSIPFRSLGNSGISVSALGLGCMGMSFLYAPTDDAENMRVLHRYLDLGGNFLDTAEVYGPYTNEELLGRFLKELPRESVVVATKFGFRLENGERTGIDSSPANVRRACDGSLRRLGIDRIDLYYQHRVDPSVPIEETADAVAELVKEGKVRALGLSEAGPETLRRAAKVLPVSVLQSEYSLWTRDVETNGVLATCRELGIAFVAYSPLGRGFLTGAIPKKLGPRSQRLAIDQSALCGSGVAKQSEVSGGGERAGREKGSFTGSIRSCLGSSARKRYDPDSGHKTGSLPEG